MNQSDFWHAENFKLDLVKNAFSQSDCRILESTVFQVRVDESS